MRWLIACLVVVILGACGGKDNSTAVADGYLPFDTMVTILADVHIAEAKATNARSVDLETGKKLLLTDYEQVFFNHGITQKKFEENYQYYAADPKLHNKLYEKVIERLQQQSIAVTK